MAPSPAACVIGSLWRWWSSAMSRRSSRPWSHQAHHFDVAPVAVRLGEAIPHARFPTGPHGYAETHTLTTPEEWEAARVTRRPLACDLRGERGPFDIIGDTHGCYDELLELLAALGYARTGEAGGWRHPAGAARHLRRRSGGSWARRIAGGAAGDGAGGERAGILRARQPRQQADARARWPQCAYRPRPARDPRPDRRAAH